MVTSRMKGLQAENLNDFVTSVTGGGKMKLGNEHAAILKPQRNITAFTENQARNRFANALLYDQTMVQLEETQHGDPKYIHASQINNKFGNIIMAQAPKSNTVVELYRMLWQYRIHTIVVTADIEGPERDFHPFFERKVGKKRKTKGRFLVRTVAIRPEGKRIMNYELKLTNLLIKGKEEQKERVVNVICLLDWDVEKPYDAKTICQAIHNVEALTASVEAHDDSVKDSPTLIMGNSGIRRTGMFACAMMLHKQIASGHISLLGTLGSVRNHRYGVLKKRMHYYNLLEIVVQLVAETGSIVPGSPEYNKIMAELKEAEKFKVVTPKTKTDKTEIDEEENEEEENKKVGVSKSETVSKSKKKTPKGGRSKEKTKKKTKSITKTKSVTDDDDLV